MATTPDDTLRAQIRLLPPAKALQERLEESIHLELYSGAGDLAVRSFNGLLASAAAIHTDPYLNSLTVSLAEGATDREKVSTALLAAGQLVGYLEGQTGLVNLGGGGKGGNSYHTAPSVNLNAINGVPAETINRALDIGAGKKEGEKAE